MSAARPAETQDLSRYIAYLPQKPPALYVDEVLALDRGKSVAGSVHFPVGHPVFANHLPGNPLVPGVILVEALAQLSAIALVPTGRPRPIRGYLGEVTCVRFRRKVRPGETVHLQCELLHRFATAARFSVRATVDGEIAAEGEIAVGGAEIDGE